MSLHPTFKSKMIDLAVLVLAGVIAYLIVEYLL